MSATASELQRVIDAWAARMDAHGAVALTAAEWLALARVRLLTIAEIDLALSQHPEILPKLSEAEVMLRSAARRAQARAAVEARFDQFIRNADPRDGF
jgi:hypothetical protein